MALVTLTEKALIFENPFSYFVCTLVFLLPINLTFLLKSRNNLCPTNFILIHDDIIIYYFREVKCKIPAHSLQCFPLLELKPQRGQIAASLSLSFISSSLLQGFQLFPDKHKALFFFYQNAFPLYSSLSPHSCHSNFNPQHIKHDFLKTLIWLVSLHPQYPTHAARLISSFPSEHVAVPLPCSLVPYTGLQRPLQSVPKPRFLSYFHWSSLNVLHMSNRGFTSDHSLSQTWNYPSLLPVYYFC